MPQFITVVFLYSIINIHEIHIEFA